MTRELGKRISSLRISYVLVMACLVPVAYADVEPDRALAAPSTATPLQDSELMNDSAEALESAVPLTEAVEELLPNYSKLTHHQLTKIGARWDQLGEPERRSLLNEVKMRMARQKGSERTLKIRTQRRYGRIVRRSDGQVLRIETKVIQVAPARRNPAERSFGVGFERRHAQPDQTTEVGSADPASELTGSESVRGAPSRRVNDNNR